VTLRKSEGKQCSKTGLTAANRYLYNGFVFTRTKKLNDTNVGFPLRIAQSHIGFDGEIEAREKRLDGPITPDPSIQLRFIEYPLFPNLAGRNPLLSGQGI
jgi:hypothetical protein